MNIMECLEKQPFQIIGMPLGKVPGLFLNVDLTSAGTALRLSAQAVDVRDRTEAFFLSITPLSVPEAVSVSDDYSIWAAVNLAKSHGSQFEEVWRHRRDVQFYRDLEDEARGLRSIGLLESAAAIEFRSFYPENKFRMVFYATPDYPCSVELISEPERCNAVLTPLVKFNPKRALSIEL